MIVRIALIALAALIPALLATGEDTQAGDLKNVDLSGQWVFKSWTHDGCDFGGTTHLSAKTKAGIYQCELVANQVCRDVTWRVRQSCTARQSGGQLVINSRIEEFLEGEATDSYWPDNFILTIRAPDLMNGSLLSHGVHASEFRRDEGGIS